MTNIEGKISDSDLKLINDLMRRVIELENLYRIISNQPKIDELEEEIRKIYKLLGLKLEDKDLQPLREIYQNLLKRVERLEDLIKENNNEDLKYEIKQIKIKLEYLESLIQGFNSGNQGEKPQGDFVNLQTFLIFKSNTEKELKSSNEKISDIYRILDEILAELRNKVNYEDLKRLEGKALNPRIPTQETRRAENCLPEEVCG